MELHVYQSMWGMEELPFGGGEPWTLEERVDRIAGAGFDGISASFTDAPQARRVCALAVQRGLRIQAMCFPQTVDDLRSTLRTVAEVGAEHVDHVDLQPDVRPFTVAECLPLLEGWQRLADDAGVAMYVETHRNRMTTDLLFTLQLLDAAPWLRLTADLSHFVVGRELWWPLGEVEHEQMRRILRHSHAYHGRVASREQVQIALGFPHHAQWVELFAGWWREGFQHFRATADDDAILTFTAELGPPWYAITGPDGDEISDRWDEALRLAALARELWAEPRVR